MMFNHPTVTILDVRNAKEELQQGILNLIKAFTAKTSVVVSGIDVRMIHTVSFVDPDWSNKVTYGVKVEVHLW